MLSQEVLGALIKSVKNLTSLKILPFVWDTTSSSGYLRVQKDLKDMIPVLVFTACNISFLSPVFILGPGICAKQAGNMAKIVMPVIELICLSLGASYQLGMYLYRYEIAAVVNKFLQFEFSDRG